MLDLIKEALMLEMSEVLTQQCQYQIVCSGSTSLSSSAKCHHHLLKGSISHSFNELLVNVKLYLHQPQTFSMSWAICCSTLNC